MASVWKHLWIRLLGFLLDYILILGYLLILTAAGLLLRLEPLQPVQRALFASPVSSQITIFLALTLPIMLYFAVCEGGKAQATWGKRRLGLRVVTTGHGPPGLGRSLVRSAIKFVPWELSHTLMWRIEGWPLAPEEPSPAILAGFGLVWLIVLANLATLLLTPGRLTLYDLIAGTRVVHDKTP